MRRVLYSPEDVSRFCALLNVRSFPMTVSVSAGRDRSNEQNALQWRWAQEVAAQTDNHPADIQAEWKLTLGVPILRAEDDEFREKYDALFKPLEYATKLQIIKLMDWPVTRRMNVKQMTHYLDSVVKLCAENGVYLTQPDRELAKDMARARG